MEILLAVTELLCCQVIRHFDGCKADLVVCDGAPDGKIELLDKWSLAPFHVFMVILSYIASDCCSYRPS
jgi:hypothetical protein